MPYRAPSPCTICGQASVSRGRCARHSRPNAHQRGYDSAHRALRERWLPLIATGDVRCVRCDVTINPTDAWDLGHNDNDRSKHSGPEHVDCNRSSARARQNAT